ncbi:MAG: Chromate resistance protein ChrB, partial [Vulcanimicrobiaceae bacterium]
MRNRGWLLLVVTSGAQEGAARIRVWRALKGLGAGILRDGVYLLPAQPQFQAALAEQRVAIEEAGGAAFLFTIPELESKDNAAFCALFDRSEEYDGILAAIRSWADGIDDVNEFDGRRSLRQLKRDYDALASVDFFPTSAQAEVRAALQAAEMVFTRRLAPEEPVAATKPLERLDSAQFHRRTWATRKRLWVDRV